MATEKFPSVTDWAKAGKKNPDDFPEIEQASAEEAPRSGEMSGNKPAADATRADRERGSNPQENRPKT